MARDITEDDLLPLPTAEAPAPLTRLERDYVMLSILVRMQHARHHEARALIEGLLALGERTVQVLMAKAVVESALGDHEAVLETIRELDRIEPPEILSGRRIEDRIRVRSFMKARAVFGLTGELDADARASLDFYLRQGRPRRKAS